MSRKEASIPIRLFDVLMGYGHGHFGYSHHFQANRLFWSLQRLFGSYERIHLGVALPFSAATFLDADIESFIIRLRIVANDIAYIVWQALPKDARGLKMPRGGTHERNREVSAVAMGEFLSKNSSEFEELARAYAALMPKFQQWKQARENVVHYKAMAVVFDSVPRSFALVNAAGTEASEPTPGGGRRVVTRSIEEFVDSELHALYSSLHVDLPSAISEHGRRLGWNLTDFGNGDSRFSATGVTRFRSRLDITD